MITRFLILTFTFMIFNCAQLSKHDDTSTRTPSSEKSILAELIKTEYGDMGVCTFNNGIHVTGQEVITQFPLTFTPGRGFMFTAVPAKVKVYYKALNPEFSRELTFRLSSYSGIYISEELLSEELDANQAKKIFNNHRNIYLQEVRSTTEKEFSMYHEGPVNFDVKEFKNYPKLVPDAADAKIGYITLFNKRCAR